MISCVLFYINRTHSKAMNTVLSTTKHCPAIAAIWLQGASLLTSRFMAKYGPNTGSEDRMQEVRG